MERFAMPSKRRRYALALIAPIPFLILLSIVFKTSGIAEVQDPAAGNAAPPAATAASAPVTAPSLVMSGASYIEPGLGLWVNQSGVNLFTNPSAGINTTGATVNGGASLDRQQSGGRLGGSCWKLTTRTAQYGQYDGMKISGGLGAWSLPPVDQQNNQYTITFYARLASTDGPTDQFNINPVWQDGHIMSPNLTLTYDWQEYSYTFTLTSPELDIYLLPNLKGGAGTAANTQVLIDGITLEGEKGIVIRDQFIGDKSYAVPPYNGNLPGSYWNGASNASTSTRVGGQNHFNGSDFGIEFNDHSWWFAMDITLGFNPAYYSFETNSKEFFVIGKPDGTGAGWTGAAYVFDYHSSDNRFYFHRYPAMTKAWIDAPPFKVGDKLRVVGVWDASRQKNLLWLRFNDDPNETYYDEGQTEYPMPPLDPDYQVNVGFSGGWWAGTWQTNSLHRDMVIEQGMPSQQQVASYLDNPDLPQLAGGFFYPFKYGLAGTWNADITPPQLTIDSPSGVSHDGSAIISASYSDRSLIDTGSVKVFVDGTELSGCSVTEARVDCSVSGLGNGSHKASVSVNDRRGNTASADSGFIVAYCAVETPGLQIVSVKSYWATLADYNSRQLSVDYSISNTSIADLTVAISGVLNTNGVSLLSAMDGQLSLTAGSSMPLTFKYLIPAQVTSFKSTVYAVALDVCGNGFAFPGPYPGA